MELTFGDIQNAAKETEKNNYVYIWFFSQNGHFVPFYVGIGSDKNRWKNKTSRSKTFRDFVKKNKCVSMKVLENLVYEVAREVEIRTKKKLVESGYAIMDAEDDFDMRRLRQAEGIVAMPIVNGKRVSARTGRSFGRQEKQVDEQQFESLLEQQQKGEITVKECCKQLGIGKSTWYERVERYANKNSGSPTTSHR